MAKIIHNMYIYIYIYVYIVFFLSPGKSCFLGESTVIILFLMKALEAYSLRSWSHLIFICCLVWESYYQYYVPKLIISVILITCLLENFFKLYIKGSQSVDCILKGRSSFPLLQSNLGILLLRQKDGWQNISFCFIWSWHVTWLSVLVLRNSAKQLAVMGKTYKGKMKPFPKLKSTTTVVGFKFWFETKSDGKNSASFPTFIYIHNYNFTIHRW